eukprot:CAMPEP_0184012856 /NCGR_PEP_ID=MMETSP0954-20121128/4678_1 /TAXON_ID=627963 /ORGANISM="Aplanochytrium sp, Strain PBS07" /LENGTH=62 /DNA_ID=CAMNT_0026292957 /DNA_START=96 /DNA_END=284 /DNA_ORIENTATION=+
MKNGLRYTLQLEIHQDGKTSWTSFDHASKIRALPWFGQEIKVTKQGERETANVDLFNFLDSL